MVSLTEKIEEMDRKVGQIGREAYPETKLLQQVKGWTLDRSHFCADTGRQSAIPEESGDWLLCGLAVEAQRFGRESATAAHHQRRGCVPAEDARTRGQLHSHWMSRSAGLASLRRV